MDPCDGRILYSDYRRHQADQVQSVIYVLEQLKNQFSHTLFRVGMTGSGAKPIAEQLGVPFIQEVAANAEALKSQYENIGTAIELGGQDAKMIFFSGRMRTQEHKCSRYEDEWKLRRGNRRIY